MKLSLILFISGLNGITFGKSNYILLLISLELILLAAITVMIYYSIKFDDILGQIYSLYIICIAGAESAIGLSSSIVYYQLRGTIKIQ